MADLNTFSFTGRLSKDAQVKTLPSGKTLTEFNVANNIGFGNYAKTNWLKVTMWGERGANIAGIFKKGCLVAGAGELSTEEYDGQDGKHHINLTVNVMNMQLLASKQNNSSTQEEPPADEDNLMF